MDRWDTKWKLWSSAFNWTPNRTCRNCLKLLSKIALNQSYFRVKIIRLLEIIAKKPTNAWKNIALAGKKYRESYTHPLDTGNRFKSIIENVTGTGLRLIADSQTASTRFAKCITLKSPPSANFKINGLCTFLRYLGQTFPNWSTRFFLTSHSIHTA